MERADAITTSHEHDRCQNGRNIGALHYAQENLSPKYTVEQKHYTLANMKAFLATTREDGVQQTALRQRAMYPGLLNVFNYS